MRVAPTAKLEARATQMLLYFPGYQVGLEDRNWDADGS